MDEGRKEEVQLKKNGPFLFFLIFFFCQLLLVTFWGKRADKSRVKVT